MQEVGIGRPETTGRGMAVEEVREGGGRQVVECFEVMSSILKSIRFLTGSQWRSWRTGVWSERWVDVSIRAAEF